MPTIFKVDLSAKMSKSKKKKLKKREKRNQALMEEAMQHVMETEPKVVAELEAKAVNGELEAASKHEVKEVTEEVEEMAIQPEEVASPEAEEVPAIPTSEAPAVLVNGTHTAEAAADLASPTEEDAKSTKSEAMSVTSPEEEVKVVGEVREGSEEREGGPQEVVLQLPQDQERKLDPCTEVSLLLSLPQTVFSTLPPPPDSPRPDGKDCRPG